MCSADIFLGVIAILFPPLPVWVKRGICSADSLINILLCVLGLLPGLIHSWYIIAKYPDDSYEYEALGLEAGGRVVWVQVPHPSGTGCHHCSHSHHGASRQQYQDPSRQKNHKHSRHQPQPQQPQQPQAHTAMNYGTQGSSSAAAGAPNSQGVPPSYAEVVAGDHKIQTD